MVYGETFFGHPSSSRPAPERIDRALAPPVIAILKDLIIGSRPIVVTLHGIGLCGAHRVGKTTLAQAVSRASGLPFLKTHTSQVFTQHRLDPAKRMPFAARLSIQRHILDAAVEVWSRSGGPFISDRTPLDMAAYTLADVQGSTRLNAKSLTQYLHDCIEQTNRFFSTLIIIPPGIPVVPEPGKAALGEAYIEHLHTLIVGLCHDPRITATVHPFARDLLALDDRIRRVLSIVSAPR